MKKLLILVYALFLLGLAIQSDAMNHGQLKHIFETDRSCQKIAYDYLRIVSENNPAQKNALRKYKDCIEKLANTNILSIEETSIDNIHFYPKLNFSLVYWNSQENCEYTLFKDKKNATTACDTQDLTGSYKYSTDFELNSRQYDALERLYKIQSKTYINAIHNLK